MNCLVSLILEFGTFCVVGPQNGWQVFRILFGTVSGIVLVAGPLGFTGAWSVLVALIQSGFPVGVPGKISLYERLRRSLFGGVSLILVLGLAPPSASK